MISVEQAPREITNNDLHRSSLASDLQPAVCRSVQSKLYYGLRLKIPIYPDGLQTGHRNTCDVASARVERPMSDEFDPRIPSRHDHRPTDQARPHRKKWRAPEVMRSKFADTEIDTGNAVDLGQPGDNRNHS